MEEETAHLTWEEEDLNTDAAEQLVEEEADTVGEILEDEMTEAISVSNHEMKEKREIVQKLEENEEHIALGEEGEEEEEILQEMEEVRGTSYRMSSVKVWSEEEYVKKKKPEPKIRKVNMDIYYPDESKTSIDEHAKKKKTSERKSTGIDLDYSRGLVDPNKDYTLVDPSFLEEFWSTEEEQSIEYETAVVQLEAEGSEVAEEEEFQEIYVQPPEIEPSEKLYDQICDSEASVSSDESFKVPRFRYIPRRMSRPTQGVKEEDNKWLPQTKSVQSIEVPSSPLATLMEHIVPALKKTLTEVATYRPSNPVYYIAHSLLHKAKSPEEMGLDPDPHLIQQILDGHKKKKKQQQIPIPKKPEEILFASYAESHIMTPPKESKEETLIIDDDEDENRSQLDKFQRKYRKAKKNIVTDERAKRSNFDRKTMLPGPCLGPTSLPLSPEQYLPSRRKSSSIKT